MPGADWPQYTSDERAVLILDRRRRIVYDPYAERRLAWEAFALAAR